jgi:hypothetical protein
MEESHSTRSTGSEIDREAGWHSCEKQLLLVFWSE